MKKKQLKVHELKVGVLYEIVDNLFPNHIYYFIDNNGVLYIKDIIVHCNCLASQSYNDVIKMIFIETE